MKINPWKNGKAMVKWHTHFIRLLVHNRVREAKKGILYLANEASKANIRDPLLYKAFLKWYKNPLEEEAIKGALSYAHTIPPKYKMVVKD
jgi:hypothetical protein